jgi:formylglycine-generating enzyme required for sulfatase activity
MKKKTFLLGFIALWCGLSSLSAQVTIGADNAPQPFSVLELISGNDKGLRLPQLTQRQRNDLQATFGAEATGKAMGLQIFNINSKCVETWNGAAWLQSCIGEPPLIVTPPAHYEPSCATTPNCIALDGFAVVHLADADLVFDETKNSALTAATGAAFKMKPVTGGVFYMGSQSSNISQPNYGTDAAATPVHQVGLSSFYMGETEVTQGLWSAVMGSNYSWIATYGMSNNHPSYYENWYACIAFCNKLSLLLGKTPVYSVSGISDWAGLAYTSIPTSPDATWNAVTCNWSANGFRLPTEAEWEYAARGGAKNEYTRTCGVSGTQYLYSGSNTIGDVAVYSGVNQGADKGGDGSSCIWVKQLQENELGLYNMSGNLWEWCWDWYGTYNSCCDVVNPRGAASGSYRVNRGGSWYDTTYPCRVSYRDDNSPNYRSNYIGFRVVLAP